MSRQRKPAYRITGPEIDLKAEVILDSKGRRVDQAYVDRALVDVEEDGAHQVAFFFAQALISGTSSSAPASP